MLNKQEDCFAKDYTYVHTIKLREDYPLTYYNWCLIPNEVYWIPTSIFFGIPNFKIGISISQFFNSGIQKKIRLESLESKTKSEFCFWWGSQKLEPNIGIPNQAPHCTTAFAWQSKSPAICLHFLSLLILFLATTTANNYVMVIKT